MQVSSRRAGLLAVLAAILVAFLPQPGGAQGQLSSIQARAIQAFQDAAAVAEAIEKARSNGHYQDASESDAPVAIMLSESCGVAGCYYSYLVSQLLSQGSVINTQATSVSAVVKISPRGKPEVTLVDLTGSGKGRKSVQSK